MVNAVGSRLVINVGTVVGGGFVVAFEGSVVCFRVCVADIGDRVFVTCGRVFGVGRVVVTGGAAVVVAAEMPVVVGRHTENNCPQYFSLIR